MSKAQICAFADAIGIGQPPRTIPHASLSELDLIGCSDLTLFELGLIGDTDSLSSDGELLPQIDEELEIPGGNYANGLLHDMSRHGCVSPEPQTVRS